MTQLTAREDKASMADRYAWAAKLTAVAMAAGTPGNILEGYWLSDRHFFYLAENFVTSSGKIAETPAIADTVTGQAGPVISLDDLAAFLSAHSDLEVDSTALGSAAFDMTDAQNLIVTLEHKAYRVDLEAKTCVSVESLPQTPELYSPDGRKAIFLKDYDIWLRERQSDASQALTSDGEKPFAYGQATLARQKPSPAGLWSPNSEWFVTQRVDERNIPEVPLIQNAPPGVSRPILHTYPFAIPDDALLPARAYVAIHIPTDRRLTIEAPPDRPLPFLPFYSHCAWFSPRSDFLYFLRADRYQTEFDLVETNLATGAVRVLLTEKAASGYLLLHPLSRQPNVRVMPDSKEIIWFSERDGWGHLYLYDSETGMLKNQITSGDWVVRDIVYIDEERRRLMFLAGGKDPDADPGNRRLYAIDFDGTHMQMLLTHDGDLSVRPSLNGGPGQDNPFRPANASQGASPSGRYVVVRRSNIDEGSQTTVADLVNDNEQLIAKVDEAIIAKGTPPRRFEVFAADTTTRLYGALFLPSDFDETKSYPVIDYIYPGPQIAMLPRTFRYLGPQNVGQAQSLAELGFVVVMVDTRGVPFRSKAFHQIGYGQLLEPQLSDHAAVIEQLCERYAFMDRQRVGMIGFSGGGFAAARALFDYPAVFKVGVSVCGNHDNRYYYAFWLEKYSGPHFKDTWEAQANSSAAHKLRGKLFLISGDMDDNVHVSQTLRLADALIKANKDFDLLIAPNEEHLLLLTSSYVQRRVWDYFVTNLMFGVPPDGFELKYTPRDLDRLKKIIARESSYS